MKRVILIVLDAVGCGFLPDAADYGDEGANTLGHVMDTCHPHLPNMAAMGLGHIDGTHYPLFSKAIGAYGRCREASKGKDTTTGHWEISGLRLEKPFPVFPEGFPSGFMKRFEERIGHETLGNKAASGTAILDELGQEHLRTGKPIVYTSGDSVFQIACHEEVYSRSQMYAFCQTARDMLQGELGVGRVIARPFVGSNGQWTRTAGRVDFSLSPVGTTLLDTIVKAGMESLAVGKIEDIFNHRGMTDSNHASGNPACIEALLSYMHQDFHGLVFANLVDTDMLYGHRRDAKGFADALEYFDSRLPEIKALMNSEDLLIITADHGCDPTFKGTDHTREHIPLLVWHHGMNRLIDLGARDTYADIAATCAEWLGLPERFNAASFASMIQ